MKYAIKVAGEDAYYAVQRFPGFTTCSKAGNPGIYDVQLFDTKLEAEKILSTFTDNGIDVYHDQWIVVEWQEEGVIDGVDPKKS